MNTKNFIVYRSSAGSGKTFTLVREYLGLVLQDPLSFKTILAITFTNKAANELKKRILDALYELGSVDEKQCSNVVSYLLDDLLKESNLNRQQIAENASETLKRILHDYSEFAVSTIDSFVYKIIRSFAFDLHIPVNFEVGMKPDELLNLAIDQLINKTGRDAKLTRFLISFVESRIDQERSWNIEKELLEVAKILLNEEGKQNAEFLKEISQDDFIAIYREISRQIGVFEDHISKVAQEALDLIQDNHLDHSAFYHKKSGIYGYFSNISKREFDNLHPNSYVIKTISEDKWVSGSVSEVDKSTVNRIKPRLMSLFESIREHIEHDGEKYLVLKEIRKTFYPVAILEEISRILSEYTGEHDILMISEFNRRIAEVVLNESVPFIYERVGEKYDHFLIDEFQDTSVLQWLNFIPLIENSLSKNFKNLVVGDGKQSIYRFRNGEVEQFSMLPQIYKKPTGAVHDDRERALIANYQKRQLEYNYRSKPGIVDFNNELYTFLKEELSDKFQPIYDDVEQIAASKTEGGFVQLEFYDNTQEQTFEEFNCSEVETLINENIQDGYEYQEIAILCRSNNSASLLARYLLERGIPVISSESLLLSNSGYIRLILSVIRLINNPADKLSIANLITLLVQLNLIDADLHETLTHVLDKKSGSDDLARGLWELINKYGYSFDPKIMIRMTLYDLCEEIIRLFELEDQSDPYFQYFLDTVHERTVKSEAGLSDFLDWWDENSHSLSISAPEGLNAVRIMTIHKAKGLEFPVVIYPFAKDRFKYTFDKIWLDVESLGIPKFRRTIVNTGKALAETRFCNELTREEEKSKLDMINLLYVVTTRPTDRLYVLCSNPPKSSGSAFSVPLLFKKYLLSKSLWSDTQFRYVFGSKPVITPQPEKQTDKYEMDSFISCSWKQREIMTVTSIRHWVKKVMDDPLEYGKIIHAVLSEIEKPDDLSAVIQQYTEQGVLKKSESEEIADIINDFLANEQVARFFNAPSFREKAILLPDGNLYRPDRIVFENGKTFIIDYKTGDRQQSHISQVKHYVNLAKDMKLIQPTGVLLYVNDPDPVHYIE